MTMQIGLRALGGKLVLAGDTKCRVTEAMTTHAPGSVPSGILSHSKVAICKRHQLAVAVASNGGELGVSPEKVLAGYLGEREAIPEDDLGDVLVEWGRQYFQEHSGGLQWEVLMYTFVIVDPGAQYTRFWKLRVGPKCGYDRSDEYMVNGHESSTAIFWPEYFKCDSQVRDIAATTNIAALTIRMGAELNPYGVGGLEVWHFDEEWKRLSPVEIEAIMIRLQDIKVFLGKSILE